MEAKKLDELLKLCRNNLLRKSDAPEQVQDKIYKLQSGRDSISPKKNKIGKIDLPKIKSLLPKPVGIKAPSLLPQTNKAIHSDV